LDSNKLGIVICTLGNRSTLVNLLASTHNLEVDYQIIVVSPLSKSLDFQKMVRALTKTDQLVFISDDGSGIYNAFNLALMRCNSEWVIFQNDDDYLNAMEINILLKTENLQKYDALFCNFRHDEKKYYKIQPPGVESWRDLAMIGKMPTSHQAQIWKLKSLIDLEKFRNNINIFNIEFKFLISSDFDLFLRAFLKNFKMASFPNIISSTSSGGISDVRVYRRAMETTYILYSNGLRTLSSSLFFLFRLILKIVLIRFVRGK
jgi:glycosyltransferase involved in cell wall biosynthesis